MSGELPDYFQGWEILHSFEGQPRDPTHLRRVPRRSSRDARRKTSLPRPLPNRKRRLQRQLFVRPSFTFPYDRGLLSEGSCLARWPKPRTEFLQIIFDFANSQGRG